MSTVPIPAEQRFVLENISWSTYVALSSESHSGGRMAYDQGTLEIMAPSPFHERSSNIIDRIVETFTEVLDIDIVGVGMTTFKREDLQKGFEADQGYYIAHAGEIVEKEEIDLAVDPPPDLALEVEISRSSLDKLGIYASLGVPEVWRYDGRTLRVFVLRGGRYVESRRSRALPKLPIGEILRFLELRHSVSDTALIRRFRTWVTDQFSQKSR